MATDVSSLTREDTSRLYGGEQHWKKPGSLRVPGGTKTAADSQGRGKPLSDEEMARRLHEELNSPEAGPAAASTRRQRKAPTFYTPQVGGYGGLHGVEVAQAQEGDTDEVPCKAAKHDAKANPSSSEDMDKVPSEGDRAQSNRPGTSTGAAPMKRHPVKRAHSAVDGDSPEHSAGEEADRDKRQRLRAQNRREEVSPSKGSAPSRPPSSKESPASARKAYAMLQGAPVLDSASDLGGRMRISDLDSPATDDRAKQGEANSIRPITRGAAMEDGDRRPAVRTTRSSCEALSEEALTPRGSYGRMVSEASGRVASDGSGRLLGMSGASSSHASEQAEVKEEDAEDDLAAVVAGPVKMPKIGKTPMVQYGKRWFRGRKLKETPHKVWLDLPGMGGAMGEPFWLSKDSQKIWRGSYKGKDWRHLGEGAWEPKQPQAPRKGRGRGHHMRAKTKVKGKATPSGDEQTEAEDEEEDEEKEEDARLAVPAESRPASSHSRLNHATRHSPPVKLAAEDKRTTSLAAGDDTQVSAKRTRQAQALEEGTGTSPRLDKRAKVEAAEPSSEELQDAGAGPPWEVPGGKAERAKLPTAGVTCSGSQEPHEHTAEELGTRSSAAGPKAEPPASRSGTNRRKGKRAEREGLGESQRAAEMAAQCTVTSPRRDSEEEALQKPSVGALTEATGVILSAGAVLTAKPPGAEPAAESAVLLDKKGTLASAKPAVAQALAAEAQQGNEGCPLSAKMPGSGLGALAQALVDSSTKTMGIGARAEATGPTQPAPKSARGRKRAAAQRLAAEARARATQDTGASPSDPSGESPHGDSPGTTHEKKGSEDDNDSPPCTSDGWKGAFKKRHQEKLAEVEAEEEAAESEDELSEDAQEPVQPAPRPIRVIRAPVRADMERSDVLVPGQRGGSREADTGTPPTPARRAGRGRGRWANGGGRGRGRSLRPMPSTNSGDSTGARPSKPGGRGRRGGRWGKRAATPARAGPEDLCLVAFNGIVDALDCFSQGMPYRNGCTVGGAMAAHKSGHGGWDSGFPACYCVLGVPPEVFLAAGYVGGAEVKEFRMPPPPLPIFKIRAGDWGQHS